MPARVLVAYSYSSTYVQATLDYLKAIRNSTEYDVDYVHVTHDAVMDFDFSRYDLVFHNYCSRFCFEGYVSGSYQEALRAFRGLKILAVQDEYDHTDRLKAAILDLGFHIVLTCVPQEALDYVYPKARFGHVEFITVFTGYVPDDFAAFRPTPKPLRDRPITVGYRGRDIGGRYGRLGFDKFEIGRRMGEICAARGIPHDIEMTEERRIYGMAWFDFVGDCRVMLGSESGSNVFDFDGSIKRGFEEMRQSLGRMPSYAEFQPFVAKRDGEISMGQISPRILECAAMRTPMVLFEGWYSGAVEPGVHYVALEKDFSNIDEVLARIEDLDALEALAERAYRHLIASGEFSYRALWLRLTPIIAARLAALPTGREAIAGAPATSALAEDMLDLAERPTGNPLGAVHFKVKLLRKQLRIYSREAERVAGEYVQGIQAMLDYAAHLHKVARKLWAWTLPSREWSCLDARAAFIQEEGTRIAAGQRAFKEKAKHWHAGLPAVKADEEEVRQLEAAIAGYRERIDAYCKDYQSFCADYGEMNALFQEAIYNPPLRPINPPAVRSPADLMKLIRWVRHGGAAALRQRGMRAARQRVRSSPRLKALVDTLRGRTGKSAASGKEHSE